MTILNVLVASSAVALGVLLNSAVPANALVAGNGHGLAARNAHTPNHNGVLKRKRSSHKNRKRCVAQQPATPSASADSSAYTPPATGGSTDSTSNNNNSGSSNNNNSNGSTGTVTYPSNPAAACQGGKVGLAWGPSMPSNYISRAITGKTCWYYNWSAWAADSSFTGNLKFVPMLWGAKSVGDFQSQVIDSSANYGIALAMNE